ncbi:MAG: dTDP-4-dehydrorhamnose reductase [Bacteroidales bacterium]|nr:dTDP-4-dehydrorhamnose reductase [Bacteroidales bacterium]OJX91736.1 MAG: dTDP-4-dehydrorhamnose reductase [Paludibacter sp. 47-17]
MTTVLVTGSNGQLGNEIRLAAAAFPQFRFLFTDVQELDITNAEAVDRYFASNPIAAIINCAAYTAVDKAEEDEELCYRINSSAVEVLGAAAARYGASMIHVSTDYVFDGKSYLPYREDFPVAPASVYGKSKLAGEQALMQVDPQAVIVRTSWLYSSFGNNFVKTMLKLGREREELKVVFDQVGTPTYAADLAVALLHILAQGASHAGIFHFSNEGVCSWYDFTISIHQLAGITTCRVLPIESREYPAKTPRPHYSVLNKAKIKSVYGVQVPHWEEGLRRCLEALSRR